MDKFNLRDKLFKVFDDKKFLNYGFAQVIIFFYYFSIKEIIYQMVLVILFFNF